MWRRPLFVLLLLLAQPGRAEERLLQQEVASKFLHPSRLVRIYLPVSYHLDPSHRYPVLYLHDGQRLTAAVAEEFKQIGWGKESMHYLDSKPLTSVELEKTGLRRDKWAEAQTSQHNEFYWRLRAWRALTFLFPPSEE